MANQSEDQFPNYLVRKKPAAFGPLIIFVKFNFKLYAYYKDAGPNSSLIVPAILLNIAGLPGIFSNLLLILVTWRKRYIPFPFKRVIYHFQYNARIGQLFVGVDCIL
jgi:hypothetical protein